MTTQKKNNKDGSRLLRQFSPYFKPYRLSLVWDLGCAGLTTLCELVLPPLVGKLTNTAAADLAALTPQLILRIAAFYIALRFVDAAASYYMASGGHVMGARIETDMRNSLFAHLQALSYSYYDNTKIGQLMSRITTDLFDVTEFAHHLPEELFIAFIKIFAGFVIFFQMNPTLALVVFAVLPLMFLVTIRSRRQMQEGFAQSRHQLGEINAQTEDSLLGIRVVKSFANEHIEREKFQKGSAMFLGIKRRSYRYMATFHTTVRLFDGLMYILVLTVGALLMRSGKISPGDFPASLLMVSTLLASIRRIVEFSEQFSRGLTGIRRFQEVMDELTEVADDGNAAEITHTEGDIRFEQVGFYYPGTENYVLRNLNLHIRPGENIAIVGPSGGGKTTLCNLIPRFYEAVEGEILLDGRDICGITLQSLRAHIGVVQQDVYLFSGSVRENIAYGKPGANQTDVEEAAKKAGAHDFICALPDGYDTYVGERGVKLSGGQKQRISIARVFLKDPAILILDEATSALDGESEQLIQQSLEKLCEGRTTLTIAHRLTTVRGAKEILVLTPEGIAERGTHPALLAKQGIYSKLYEQYAL